MHLKDLRYGSMTKPDESLWKAHFDVTADGEVVARVRSQRPDRANQQMGPELSALRAIVLGEGL